MDINKYLGYWAECYREDLVQNIMPFWMKYGLDREHGGVYTCVARDGELMDTTKSVWFQGRFAYTCCFAYNNIEQRQEWLDAAKHMFFEVAADGTPLRKRRYVFSESFAAIAMAEYSKATGNRQYAEKAMQIFREMRKRLNTPGMLEPKYLPTVEAIGHSITMILINVANVLKQVIDDPELDEQTDISLESLTKNFVHPEFVARDCRS